MKIQREVKGETREQQIARINKKSQAMGNALKSRARHERRHSGGSRPSLADRKKQISEYSKDR